MSYVKGYPSQGNDGLAYNVEEYKCSGDKDYLIHWKLQNPSDSSS